MKKVVIMILILAAVLLLASTFFIFKSQGESECQSDSECVAAGCCHPNSCTKISAKQNCSGSICSQVCSGPLDCGAGSCGCVKNKCSIVPNE